MYSGLSAEDQVRVLSELRNARIAFTKSAHGVENLLYHCVVRQKGRFSICEEEMVEINTGAIKEIKQRKGSISFDDGICEYSFLTSKSTLAKRFITDKNLYSLGISMIEDPLADLFKLCDPNGFLDGNKYKTVETVFLPLYGKNKTVYERSGLNQWNARGRKRHFNEVYIPIPTVINQIFPSFFPLRDKAFILRLPNGKEMKAKVCQDNRKALMSYSNRELGGWILRKVLKIGKGKLLKYGDLQKVGVDSVRIDKYSDLDYEINFAKTGSYEEFLKRSLG